MVRFLVGCCHKILIDSTFLPVILSLSASEELNLSGNNLKGGIPKTLFESTALGRWILCYGFHCCIDLTFVSSY